MTSRLVTVLAPHALVPIFAAVLAVVLVAGTGFTERSLIGTALEDRFYGFFFRSYPLFLFAAVYGAARIVSAAIADPGARKPLRAFSTPIAVLVFLAACFYPTFGGIILRPGYMTGGMSFVRGQSATIAIVLGAGAAAFAYAAVLGVCVVLARLTLGFGWRKAGRVVLRLTALWLGALILLAPARLGADLTGAWPAGPLSGLQAATIAGVVALALLPHAAAVALAGRRRTLR